MTLLVLDGNSILNRAFYGVKALTTKDGRYTNAIFGFLNIYFRLIELTKATHVAAAFDLSAPTFRHTMYTEYKAGRKHMPDELREQLPVIKELLPLLGVTVVTKEGYEADDILGTLSAAAESEGATCFLATGDRDSLQLVSDKTTVLLAATKGGQPDTAHMDTAAVFEKYGLTPAQLIDLKALMGDASDHIPGVAGVGEKTALSLLHEFGSLDALYQALDEAPMRDSLRQKLIAGKDSAYLSRRLGTIDRAVPIDTALESYRLRDMDRDGVSRILTDLECFKLLDKLGLQANTAPAPDQGAACGVPCEDATWDDVLAADGILDVLLTENGVYAARGRRGCLLDDLTPLKAFLCDAAVPKRTHDGKALYKQLLAQGLTPAGFVTDTALAAYLLNPLSSDYSLSRLLIEYGIVGETDAPHRWFGALADILDAAVAAEDEQASLLRDIELPLSLVLADMELCGVQADKDGLLAYGEALQADIDRLQQGVWDEVGYEFNLNSPKQLAKALFDDMALPHGKKTKSGWSTSADVLEKLRDVPVVSMLLEYRTLAKLRSTYCDGLAAAIGDDGRIHSTFNQTETRTGRISSADPNLQNIPVRQPQGKELRRFLGAKDGHVLVDADYSQIELRVLAAMANDPAMIDGFNSGEDIHRITASQVFGVPLDLVSPLMRSRAKAVNFGIVYGIGAHSLSEDIGVSFKEAKAYIDGYLAHYGGIAAFMDALITDAKETGCAKTLFGRRRPLPELKAGNAILRGFGERVARNMPIQGTAADIIKIAMIRVYNRLKSEGFAAKLILQVHDELMVEAPAEEAERVSVLLKEEMERAAALTVTLTADVHVGKTWFDAKE